jgi:hypothetical protein
MTRHQQLLYLLRVVLLLLLLNLLEALSNVAVTPIKEELRSIATSGCRKVEGSASSLKAWRNWSSKTIQLIRSDLPQSLTTPVDIQALNDLSFSLGVAADVGAMPSFANQGARAGYAVHYFCRAQLMADLLFSSDSYIFSKRQ